MLLPSIIAIEECTRVQKADDIPCRITSSWSPPQPCQQHSIIIFNDNGTVVQTANLSNFGTSSFCSYDWNITAVGSYPYNLTYGDTGVLIVEDARVELLLYFSMGIAILLLIIALWKEDQHVASLSAIAFIVAGVFLLVDGFAGTINLLTKGIAIVLWAVGVYVFLKANIENF